VGKRRGETSSFAERQRILRVSYHANRIRRLPTQVTDGPVRVADFIFAQVSLNSYVETHHNGR